MFLQGYFLRWRCIAFLCYHTCYITEQLCITLSAHWGLPWFVLLRKKWSLGWFKEILQALWEGKSNMISLFSPFRELQALGQQQVPNVKPNVYTVLVMWQTVSLLSTETYTGTTSNQIQHNFMLDLSRAQNCHPYIGLWNLIHACETWTE